ncbi:MAG: YkgJ family cysteine cluster protein [Pseudomonadota bacterium]|nr:YkgJ family cysteine cluster protein [Pseudomonadota bacterium]MEC8525127.1 YkgJ family cysteine cluster protein [Pseudomonadota bacterium]
MNCEPGCGACCIAPSITTPIPGMPKGKPAGVRCVQLDDNNLCRLFGDPSRPAVCGNFKADADICGAGSQQAMANLIELEQLTQ